MQNMCLQVTYFKNSNILCLLFNALIGLNKVEHF